MNKKLLLIIAIIAMSGALAANPGHTAASVSPGTFNTGGPFTFPESLNVNGNFIVNTSTLFINATTGQVAIGNTTPPATTKLYVQGNFTVDNQSDICIQGGKCLSETGTGSGDIGGSGTTNTIPRFTASTTLGNSIITQSANTISIAGNLSLPSTGFFIGEGASILNSGGYSPIAIGPGSLAGDDAVVLGANSNATQLGSITIGTNATNEYRSIALGYFASTTANQQFIVGSQTAPITNFFIGEGITTSTPQDIRIQASGTTGTNSATGNLILAGGRSTGNATPGQILFETTTPTTTGSTQQTLTTRAQINQNGFEVDGGVRLNTTTTKPTCDETQRGTIWFEQATTGNDDLMYACMKSAAETYNWVLVARGS